MNFGRAKFKNKPKQENPKVKQTRKVVQDGITFDSPLENYTYNLFKENSISFELKKKYVLQPSFSYCGQTVLAVTLTVDFYLPEHDIIVDPKGFQHGATDIKWKLLKYHLLQNGQDPRICFVYSQKSARALVESIKNGFTEDILPKFINGRIKRLRKAFKLVGDTFINNKGESVCNVSQLNQMTDYDLYKLLK